MVVNIILALRYVMFCAFYANQESILNSKFITDAAIQTNTSTAIIANIPKTQFEKLNTVIRFDIPTSDLGHSKVPVLYRQPARQIHKYEEL